MKAQEFAQALRDAAAWWDEHPDTQAPDDAALNVWVASRDEFAAIARQIGHAEKQTSGGIYWLRKRLGPLAFDFNVTRSEVCTRRVVGTKIVPASVVEEHVEEIVEWDCGTIFGDGVTIEKDTEA